MHPQHGISLQRRVSTIVDQRTRSLVTILERVLQWKINRKKCVFEHGSKYPKQWTLYLSTDASGWVVVLLLLARNGH